MIQDVEAARNERAGDGYEADHETDQCDRESLNDRDGPAPGRGRVASERRHE